MFNSKFFLSFIIRGMIILLMIVPFVGAQTQKEIQEQYNQLTEGIMQLLEQLAPRNVQPQQYQEYQAKYQELKQLFDKIKDKIDSKKKESLEKRLKNIETRLEAIQPAKISSKENIQEQYNKLNNDIDQLGVQLLLPGVQPQQYQAQYQQLEQRFKKIRDQLTFQERKLLEFKLEQLQKKIQPGQPGGQSGQPGGQSGQPGIIEIPNPLDITDVVEILNRILGYIWVIAIPISSIMTIYAGVLFMTAGGDEKKIANARRTLLYVIIGIIVVILSTGLHLILEDILKK